MILIQSAIPEDSLLGFIPFSEELRLSDRTGQSVLDNLNENLKKSFEDILNLIEGK